jgi:8-oxo-dGTP pyrophosphatase MutT (NUDIX family)
MAEMIDIYTKEGIKIGTISKKEYYSLNGDIPWIKCCTCFVVDQESNKILFEKRGKRFLDPGKLDLCSGHVRSGEVPIQGMVRELGEELNIPESVARNIQYLGKMDVDYTNLEDETNRKNLKCFVSCYALKVKNQSEIAIDGREAINKGWLNYDDSIGFISNSMTRLPYENSLVEKYDAIFDKLRTFMNLKQNKNVQKEKGE